MPGLAALNAMTHAVWTVTQLTYMTAETVGELLSPLARAPAGIPLTIILDNARYQRCARVQTVVNSVGIEGRSLPTYSPNLNLIERVWKFVKKQCLDSKYDPDRESFHHAISTCIAQASSTHKKALLWSTSMDAPGVSARPVRRIRTWCTIRCDCRRDH